MQKFPTFAPLAVAAIGTLPLPLRNRESDNWRVLLAIADNLTTADNLYGHEARAAATALCADRLDEDEAVVLASGIQTVFRTLGTDRIIRKDLFEALVGLEDGYWSDGSFTEKKMVRMLNGLFHIRTKAIWPMPRLPTSKSHRGYYASQFEKVWRAYCPQTDTPTQPSKIISLPRP